MTVKEDSHGNLHFMGDDPSEGLCSISRDGRFSSKPPLWVIEWLVLHRRELFTPQLCTLWEERAFQLFCCPKHMKPPRQCSNRNYNWESPKGFTPVKAYPGVKESVRSAANRGVVFYRYWRYEFDAMPDTVIWFCWAYKDARADHKLRRFDPLPDASSIADVSSPVVHNRRKRKPDDDDDDSPARKRSATPESGDGTISDSSVADALMSLDLSPQTPPSPPEPQTPPSPPDALDTTSGDTGDESWKGFLDLHNLDAFVGNLDAYVDDPAWRGVFATL